MNKYISPEIEIQNLHSADVITSSSEPIIYGALEGVDDENSKSAIFNAEHWITHGNIS